MSDEIQWSVRGGRVVMLRRAEGCYRIYGWVRNVGVESIFIDVRPYRGENRESVARTALSLLLLAFESRFVRKFRAREIRQVWFD